MLKVSIGTSLANSCVWYGCVCYLGIFGFLFTNEKRVFTVLGTAVVCYSRLISFGARCCYYFGVVFVSLFLRKSGFS